VHLHAVTDTDLNPLLIGLTVKNETDPLVPELEQLIIEPDRWTAESPSVEPLLTMVVSRTGQLDPSGCELKRLTIVRVPNFPRDVDDSLDLERQLRALHMSRVEQRRWTRYGKRNAEIVVKHVWPGSVDGIDATRHP